MLTLSHFFLCLLPVARIAYGSQTTLKTIPIQLTTDAERRYVMQVDMAKQRYKFALSMGTGYCVVAGTECSSCNTDVKYDLSSLASGETTGNNSVQIIGGSLSGGMMLENCSFIQASGASWDYINHPMLLANESSSLITPGISGILGLGTNRHNGDFNNSGLGVWLSRNPSNSNISFGLQLNPPTASSRQGGTFDWLVPDQTAYVGDISWRTLAIVSNASINSDWIIELDSWNVSVSERSSTSRSGEMNAIVEPYVPSLIFPYAEAMSIYDRVADANKSGISATSYLWSVPCQTRMSLTVTFGAQSFSINEDYLVQNLNGSCWGSIEGWSDENETLYLLGSAFVSSIYLVASASGVDQGSLGFAKRAEPPRKLEAGTIAGVTLGSVACAILLYLGILQSYKFWRLQHPTYKRLNGPQPFVLSQPTASQAPTALMPVRRTDFRLAEGEEMALQILPSPTRPKSYALSYVQSPFSGSDTSYSIAGYSGYSTTASPSTPAFPEGQANSIFTTQMSDSMDSPPPYKDEHYSVAGKWIGRSAD